MRCSLYIIQSALLGVSYHGNHIVGGLIYEMCSMSIQRGGDQCFW